MAKRREKFDPQAMVHRLLSFVWNDIRMRGRIVAAGYRTPVLICYGDITPHPYLLVALEGAEDYTSTNPRDTVEIIVGSTTWGTIQWRGRLKSHYDLFPRRETSDASGD